MGLTTDAGGDRCSVKGSHQEKKKGHEAFCVNDGIIFCLK